MFLNEETYVETRRCGRYYTVTRQMLDNLFSLKFDELMKRETDYCFSAHFLLIGYSSTLHQRMKGNERKIVAPRENAISLFHRQYFLLTAHKTVMKQ